MLRPRRGSAFFVSSRHWTKGGLLLLIFFNVGFAGCWFTLRGYLDLFSVGGLFSGGDSAVHGTSGQPRSSFFVHLVHNLLLCHAPASFLRTPMRPSS